MPERTVNGDVMLCTDPINAALVEGLPLIKVLSESLKEMTDSVVRERNAGVITADKCPVVLLLSRLWVTLECSTLIEAIAMMR